MEKSSTLHTLCKGEAASRDGGKLYWQAWEQGKMGATKPANPIMNPEGFATKVLQSSSCCGGKKAVTSEETLKRLEEIKAYSSSSNHPKSLTFKNFTPVKVSSVSQIGTYLKGIIEEATGVTIPCSECKAEIERLNELTSPQVLAEIESLALRITERSRSNAQRWYHKIVAALLPELVLFEVKKWIRQACTMHNLKTQSTLRWQYGLTTVLSRSKDLLPKTLESLANAGFDSPRLFVDGCTPQEAVSIYGTYNLPLTIRDNVKTAGNWVLTLYELWIRDTTAERYAIFQDDFVTSQHLRRYLELSAYPSEGYQNLYTFPSNQSIAPPGFTGWYPSNQMGKGAVALVFSNEAVTKLLGQPYLVERFRCLKRGHKAIDGGIVDAMKSIGWKEYVHTPSLVQHTGDKSSMGNLPHSKAISFPGEEYNLLDLLKA